jgi:CheY-like chemotaxis protein
MGDRELHVVLVEDDELNVINVTRALQNAGIKNRLWVAHNGREALVLLRGRELPETHRVVLLDLEMPGMNGFQLLKELRSDPYLRSTPVVILTTSRDPEDVHHAYAFHVAGYLVKPSSNADQAEKMTAFMKYWASVELV